jgi:predicted DNA-binding protein YlxM (UPF0122 family)
MPEHLTQSEFARRVGVSKQAVHKAINKGRLTESIVRDGDNVLVKEEQGMEEWQKTMKSFTPTTEKLKTAEQYNQARTLKETFNAKLAKLEFDEKSGLLVSKELVKKQAFEAGRITRNQILAIPDRVAGELAACSDTHECFTILTNELVKALENLDEAF